MRSLCIYLNFDLLFMISSRSAVNLSAVNLSAVNFSPVNFSPIDDPVHRTVHVRPNSGGQGQAA